MILSSSHMPCVLCGMRDRLLSCAAVFRPVRCSLRYVRRSSVLPGMACAVVFHSARCSMHGVFPFRLGQHARWSSVSPGAAYAEIFHSVWRGPVCAAVFRSVWRGTVCLAVFYSVLRGPVCTVVLRVRHRWSRITNRTAGRPGGHRRM